MTETAQDMLARLTGFTPGPWVKKFSVHYYGMVQVNGPGLRCVGFTIARNVTWKDGARIEADAALIAAAPDLHAAVVELLAWKAAALAREAALRARTRDISGRILAALAVEP